MPALFAIFLLCLAANAQLVRQDATSLALPADLPAATGYTTENALGTLTFTSPICTAIAPGETNRLFVAERAGTIQAVTNLATTPAKTPFLNLSTLLSAGQSIPTNGERGFLSLTFHPDFATNGTLFVYFTILNGGTTHQRLHQITVTDPSANTATIFSHKPILTILDRLANHNGGDLHFGPDRFLYLSLGDEGGSNDQLNNARFINHDSTALRTGFWGQLLRIAVETDPKNQPGTFPAGTLAPNPHIQNSATFPSAIHGNHRIPADNPFIGRTQWHSIAIDPLTVRTEIFATGLRNPVRWSFDPPTGRLFLGDVGQGAYEEINLVSKGDDLGWSWREGMHPFTSAPAPSSPPPGTDFSPREPIYEYDRLNDGIGNDAVLIGRSVTGGMIYRGNRLTELFGAYVFADHETGALVALREQPGGSWTGTRLGTDDGITDFGTHPLNNDLLLCDLWEHTIKRLARTGTTGTPPPPLLSQTGIFSDLSTLAPHPGIVSYQINTPSWNDHALTSRWFATKSITDTITFSENSNWSFPAGMLWVQHFDIETTPGSPATRRKLETRILVKTNTSSYGITYKWREDQTDADLVPEQGLTETIPSSNPPQTWSYPSRAECRTCHTHVGGHALAFHTRQLNRDHTHGSQTLNQIAAMRDALTSASAPASYFTTSPPIHTLPALAPVDDTTTSLEWRVRSYLDANCSHCHQPGGPSLGHWDARSTTPTDSAALINGPLVHDLGDPANRWAVPGDTAHSAVLHHLSGIGASRMPPLATHQRDLAAEALITAWIDSELPSRQSFAQWQTTHFGSTTHPDAQPSQNPDHDTRKNDLEFLLGSDPLANDPPYQTLPAVSGTLFSLTFTHPPNRSVLIETTTDLQTWTPWDIPGNTPVFPSSSQQRVITGPLAPSSRFFRLRLASP